MTIVEFLTARLDEDEDAALEVVGLEHWRTYDGSRGLFAVADLGQPVGLSSRVGEVEDEYRDALDHITRHDPHRVLADIAAKRAIVDAYAAELRRMDPNPEGVIGRRCLEWTLEILTSVYSGHPDYDSAWVSPQASTPRG